MKVLTVVGELDKGGTARGAYAFARRFKELGGDSRFCFVYGGGLRRKQIEAEGIIVIALDDLEERLKEDQWHPDIIHIHSHGLTLTAVTNLRRLYGNARLVETNIFSRVCKWEYLLETSYQLSDWGLVQYRRQNANNGSNILRYPIFDSSSFRPRSKETDAWRKKYSIKSSDIVIGRVGQAYSGKWSCHLLSIFESVCRTSLNVKLVVVNAPKDVLERIRISPYSRQVISIESIESDLELARCYSSIDIFLHIAEQGESYGLVIQESLLCGTPVITLETPWGDNAQKEHLSRGECGFSVRTRKEMLDKVLLLARDKPRAKEMGASGRASLLEHAACVNELLVLTESKSQAVAPNKSTQRRGEYLLRQKAAILVRSLGFSTTLAMACVGFVDALWLKKKLGEFLVQCLSTKVKRKKIEKGEH